MKTDFKKGLDCDIFDKIIIDNQIYTIIKITKRIKLDGGTIIDVLGRNINNKDYDKEFNFLGSDIIQIVYS